LTSILIPAFLLFHAISVPVSYGQFTDEDIAGQIERIENGLLPYHVVPGETAFNIKERMRQYNVPGVSVAVISDGKILWARGWGKTDAENGTPVNTETMFQAASISKPVAAAGALLLVEQGLLSYDSDVNKTLQSWQYPENEFTRTEKVTLRRLLSHSAGTNVHGFPGYSYSESIPTITELLDGAAHSNTDPVRVAAEPGSQWQYSGGGTSIVQLMMSDVTGLPFDEMMQKHVLEPAGMEYSTFSQPLPESFRSNAASGHLADGTPIDGKYHTYPEQAAAGLWATPTDLARFAIEIQSAYTGKEGRVLSPRLAKEMLTLEAGNWGLGFSIEQEIDGDFWFTHGGSNAGFRAYFAMLCKRGTGVIIMSNGERGGELNMEVLRAISAEYGLPKFRPVKRETVELDIALLESFTGKYYPPGDAGSSREILHIHLDGTVLRADVPPAGWKGIELRPVNESTFFFLDNPAELKFERGKAGDVSRVIITNLGQPIILDRR